MVDFGSPNANVEGRMRLVHEGMLPPTAPGAGSTNTTLTSTASFRCNPLSDSQAQPEPLTKLDTR